MKNLIPWNYMGGGIFIANYEGHDFKIVLGAALGHPYWEIVKNGQLIECCYYHHTTKNDLTAKVQVEKVYLENVQQKLTFN